jgi:hypothetical protein
LRKHGYERGVTTTKEEVVMSRDHIVQTSWKTTQNSNFIWTVMICMAINTGVFLPQLWLTSL